MKGVDKMRIVGKPLTDLSAAKPVFNFFTGNIGMRQNTNTSRPALPLTCKNRKFRDDESCLTAIRAGRNVQSFK